MNHSNDRDRRDPATGRWSNLPKTGGTSTELRESVKQLNEQVRRDIKIYSGGDDPAEKKVSSR